MFDVHRWYRGYWNFNERVPKRVIFDAVHPAHKDPGDEGGRPVIEGDCLGSG